MSEKNSNLGCAIIAGVIFLLACVLGLSQDDIADYGKLLCLLVLLGGVGFGVHIIKEEGFGLFSFILLFEY